MGLGLSWISLDSLVRNKIFQWFTRYKAGKIFSCAFWWRSSGRGPGPSSLDVRTGRIGHQASLTWILFSVRNYRPSFAFDHLDLTATGAGTPFPHSAAAKGRYV
jgi:hypothetical protein